MTKGTKWMVVISGMFLALAFGMLLGGPTEQQAVSAQSPDGHSLDAADGDPTDAVFVDNDGKVVIRHGFLEVWSNLQEQPRYVIGETAGLAAGWNFSGGHAEVDFWNTFAGHAAVPGVSEARPGDSWPRGFKFLQQTDSGTPRELMWLRGNGDVAIGTTWIKGNGDVGIGTTNPAAPLEIAHSCSGCDGLYLTTTGDASGFNNTPFLTWHAPNAPTNKKYSMRFQADSSTFVMGTGDGSDFKPQVTIDGTTGNVGVGIGASIPEHKLSVKGTVQATEVIVVAPEDFPDFVFEDEYKLMTLAALEEYISQHGHLPGIPSAEEVGEKGLHVGEMQTALLQKIEELTLHVIDLKKENDALKDQVEALRD